MLMHCAVPAMQTLHFVAWRKVGMELVYQAYMQKGTEAAYAAWAALPHTESGYNSTSWQEAISLV